jgi:hypothetical protein
MPASPRQPIFARCLPPAQRAILKCAVRQLQAELSGIALASTPAVCGGCGRRHWQWPATQPLGASTAADPESECAFKLAGPSLQV